MQAGGNEGGYRPAERPAPSSAIGDGFMNIPDGVEDEGSSVQLKTGIDSP